jgi:hypothetical protein
MGCEQRLLLEEEGVLSVLLLIIIVATVDLLAVATIDLLTVVAVLLVVVTGLLLCLLARIARGGGVTLLLAITAGVLANACSGAPIIIARKQTHHTRSQNRARYLLLLFKQTRSKR